ncbi:MAG: hypothetical protein Q4A88_04190 [Clostridia bacterium]|nr:hypothetical protein [Clostridia bacterium]
MKNAEDALKQAFLVFVDVFSGASFALHTRSVIRSAAPSAIAVRETMHADGIDRGQLLRGMQISGGMKGGASPGHVGNRQRTLFSRYPENDHRPSAFPVRK